MDVLRKLVNKGVAGIFRNADKDKLRFVLADGSELGIAADGDCCSHSWFEHLSGVGFLVGANVAAIEPGAEVPQEDNHPEHDCLQFYNYNIRTDKGICALEMRNSSNGYYGGSIEEETPNAVITPIAVTDDF